MGRKCISCSSVRDFMVPVSLPHELALEVRAPQIVRRGGARERRALRLVATFAAVSDQSMPIEHGVHGADGGRLQVRVAAPEYRVTHQPEWAARSCGVNPPPAE